MKKASNAAGNLVIGLDRCIALAGDIKVEFYNKPKVMRKKNILFRFWFNTYFVNDLQKGKSVAHLSLKKTYYYCVVLCF